MDIMPTVCVYNDGGSSTSQVYVQFNMHSEIVTQLKYKKI